MSKWENEIDEIKAKLIMCTWNWFSFVKNLLKSVKIKLTLDTYCWQLDELERKK